MSDTPQGEGWWVASDGKWYPPELHADPDYRRKYEAVAAEPTPEIVTEPEPVAAEPTPEIVTEPEPAAAEPTPEIVTEPEPAAAEPTPEIVTEPEPAAAERVTAEVPPIPPPAPIDGPPETVPPMPQMPPAAPLPLSAPDPTVFPSTPPQMPPPMPAPVSGSDTSDSGSSSKPWLWVAILGVLIAGGVAAAIFALTGGDDDEASVTVDTGTEQDGNGGEAGGVDADDETSSDESDSAASTESGNETSSEESDGSDDTANAESGDDPAETDSDGSDGLDPDGVGTPDNPAGFGETYVWDTWHASLVDTVDPAQAGLLDEYAESPAAGNVFVAAIYDVTFTGNELASYLPLAITASGARVYDTFGCLLNERALAQQGIDQYTFEALAGQTVRQAECFEVPEGDVDSLIFAIQNYEELFGDNEVIFARGGAALPDPPPVVATPDFASLDVLPFGETTTWPEWSGSVLEMRDAEAESMVSTFAEPSRDGFTYTAVVYEVTYTGTSASEYVSLTLAGLGSQVYEGFNSCILDTDVTAAEGIETIFEMAPGQTALLAQCFEIADEDLGSLVFRLTNATDFDAEPAYYSDAG